MKVPQNPPNPNTPSGDVATQQWVRTYYGSNNPPVVASPIASGPPGSLGSGGIWIATNVDANGTCWQFRYNANSSSAYKWEFIGGPPAFVSVETNESTASTTYVDLTTVGPSFTCVRGGDYLLQIGVDMSNNTVNDGGAAAPSIAGAAPSDSEALFHVGGPAGLNLNFGGKVDRILAIAAGGVITLQYRVTTGGTANFLNRRIIVTPIRVA